jgi:hypothetical protein
MKAVRDKRGLAYSVHSYFQPLAQLGPFQIGLQTKKAQASEALAGESRGAASLSRTGPERGGAAGREAESGRQLSVAPGQQPQAPRAASRSSASMGCRSIISIAIRTTSKK